jgi:hypothetical protein
MKTLGFTAKPYPPDWDQSLDAYLSRATIGLILTYIEEKEIKTLTDLAHILAIPRSRLYRILDYLDLESEVRKNVSPRYKSNNQKAQQS